MNSPHAWLCLLNTSYREGAKDSKLREGMLSN